MKNRLSNSYFMFQPAQLDKENVWVENGKIIEPYEIKEMVRKKIENAASGNRKQIPYISAKSPRSYMMEAVLENMDEKNRHMCFVMYAENMNPKAFENQLREYLSMFKLELSPESRLILNGFAKRNGDDRRIWFIVGMAVIVVFIVTLGVL